MKIKLLDWKKKETWVEIPDDTQVIVGCVLSGDMVMEHPIYKDSSEDRITDFYDGSWSVKREDFDKLNDLTDSYDVFEISKDFDKE